MSTTAVATISYTPDQIDLIKRTVAKGATDDEFALFLGQCKRTGLDPFLRQIHAVKRWDAKQQREVMAIQTGIDGYRLIAERTGCYVGSDEPVYDREDGPHPNKATVTVWKLVGGQRVPFSASARWAEYVQTTKDGRPNRFWQQMPYHMLAKVAESLALRKAFPQDLSGVYTDDEMAQADRPAVEVGTPAKAASETTAAKALPAAPAAPAGMSEAEYGRLFKGLAEAGSADALAAAWAEVNAHRKVLSTPQVAALAKCKDAQKVRFAAPPAAAAPAQPAAGDESGSGDPAADRVHALLDDLDQMLDAGDVDAWLANRGIEDRAAVNGFDAADLARLERELIGFKKHCEAVPV